MREPGLRIENCDQDGSIQLNQSKRGLSGMVSKPKQRVGAGLFLTAVVALVIAGSHRTAAALPRPASNVEVPKFVVDPS